MNELQSNPQTSQTGQQDKMTTLFVNMVLQYSNFAWMCLGKMAYPDSGKTTVDLNSAKLMIDQLEMLLAKTNGNLSKQESDLLAQTLTDLRLNYVEVAGSQGAKNDGSTPALEPKPAPAESTASASGARASSEPADAKSEGGKEEPRKRFTKKY